MTKIRKKAQVSETEEVVTAPAEPQTELVEAPKEVVSEESPSDEPTFEFKEASNQDMEPTDEEKQDIEVEFEPELEEYQDDFNLDDVMDDDDAFELLDALEADDLPSLDEIKAKERALRKR